MHIQGSYRYAAPIVFAEVKIFVCHELSQEVPAHADLRIQRLQGTGCCDEYTFFGDFGFLGRNGRAGLGRLKQKL